MNKHTTALSWQSTVLLLCAYAIFAWQIVLHASAHESPRVVADVIWVIVFTRLAYFSNRRW